jgi:hypothetical protein
VELNVCESKEALREIPLANEDQYPTGLFDLEYHGLQVHGLKVHCVSI